MTSAHSEIKLARPYLYLFFAVQHIVAILLRPSTYHNEVEYRIKNRSTLKTVNSSQTGFNWNQRSHCLNVSLQLLMGLKLTSVEFGLTYVGGTPHNCLFIEFWAGDGKVEPILEEDFVFQGIWILHGVVASFSWVPNTPISTIYFRTCIRVVFCVFTS